MARRRDESALSYSQQVTATLAKRAYSMTMLRIWMTKHNFVGQRIPRGHGWRRITRRMVEIMADALRYPKPHTRLNRIGRIGGSTHDVTIAPALAKLTELNVLFEARATAGNANIYSLNRHFIENVLEEKPRLDFPEPLSLPMYPDGRDADGEP